MKNIKIIIALLASAVLLFACQDNAISLNPKEFNAALSDPNIQLIDVRTPGEFASEHIKNATNIDINGESFDSEIDKLDKNKPVYVYCLSGGRSSSAAKILKSKGFNNIFELKGGVLAWTKDNMPVESSKPKTKNTASNTIESNFMRSIGNDTLTLVDFFAYWCGPCMKMKPSIEKLEKELKADVEILSIDVDVQKKLAQQYQITAMPTLIFFKNNKEVNRVLGFKTEQELRDLIAKYK